MPTFSVIIPLHNRAKLIEQTLDSVFAQSPAAETPEVIVVDDGSTDGGAELVESRYAGRVVVLRQQNKGPGAARNMGIRAATGEYVCLLDSDDLWLPWTLGTYQRVIEQHSRPAFIAGCAFWFRDEAELAKISQGELRVTPYADFYASSPRGLYFGASWFVVRRDALLAVGGFTDRWINAEDHDLGLRLGTANCFVNIEAPATFAFRRHEGTAWANTDRSFQGYSHLIEEEHAGRYPGGAGRSSDRRRLITMHARGMSLTYLRMGVRDRAWYLYRRTFPWQLRLGRYRYLLGFPVQALLSRFRGKGEAPPPP